MSENNKPPIMEAIELLVLKYQVSRLYAEIDDKVADLRDRFGANRFDYDLNELPDPLPTTDEFTTEVVQNMLGKGLYFKLEIVDNLSKLITGEQVSKSVGFTPVTFSSSSLKRKPESLKEK